MAMQLAVDESGGKGKDGWFAFAGLLADVSAWDAFTRAWDDCLRSEPAIKYFKAAEAAKCGGQFNWWSEARRDAKMRELVPIIDAAAPVLLFTARDNPTFEALVAARLPAPANHPYFWGFFQIIGTAYLHQRWSGRREPIEIIFDTHESTGRDTRAYYEFMLARVGPFTRSLLPDDIIFRHDTKFLPLQASDLFAYMCRCDQDGIAHPFGWVHDATPNVKGALANAPPYGPMVQHMAHDFTPHPEQTPEDVIKHLLRVWGMDL